MVQPVERVTLSEYKKVFPQRKCGCATFYIVTEEDLEKMKDYQLYSDDLCIASYPKSGTTWIQQIVKLLRSNGEQDDKTIIQSIPYLEGMSWYKGGVEMESLQRPRAFMSHFPYDLFPCGRPDTLPCKFIYVARNVKDVAVSYFFFLSLFFRDMEWEEYWPLFVSWKFGFNSYFDHVLGWWQRRNDDNILFLKYEDMKKDLPGTVAKIASFIGVAASDEVLSKVAELTTFDKMKSNPTTNYEWRPTEHKFIRKGVVGDWKNFLTEEQSAQLDKMCSEKLEGTGLEFEFE